MRNRSVTAITVLAVFSFCFISIKPAQALAINPGLTNLEIKPGQTGEFSIDAVNDENSEQTYYINVQKFLPKGTSGQQQFASPQDQSGLPSWIETSESKIVLMPGEGHKVKIRISVPATASSGGYYAAVFFSTQPAGGEPTSSVGSRTGSLLLLTVSGNIQHRMWVRTVQTDSGPVVRSLPVTFNVNVRNDGNVHELPVGRIIVTNIFGLISAILPLNSGGGYILPNSSRVFSVTWQRRPPTTGHGFLHDLHEEVMNFALGPYQAQADLEGAATFVAPQTVADFSVKPKNIFIVLFVLVGFLYALARLVRVIWGKWTRAVPK